METQVNELGSKPHYAILDGLRGVASVLVVAFHLLEAHTGGDHARQLLNHGYLAVDFFFLLSGFVLGYAYDDRKESMSIMAFVRRRIIRLQPMVVMGSLFGAALFYFQTSPAAGMGGIHAVPVWKMLLVMAIGCTLFPVGRGFDIRGWQEMHPLNGPAWSLFFEYIANAFYILVLRNLSTKILAVLTVLAAAISLHYLLTSPNGDMVGGWTIDDIGQVRIGLTRLAYPFLAGLLMSRIGCLRRVRYAFPACACLLTILFAFPRVGGAEGPAWMNGSYEAFCILLAFPFIVWMGAGGKTESAGETAICRWLGTLSYPLYIIHYPLVYLYTAWVANHGLELQHSWPGAVLAFGVAVLLAWLAAYFYDQPVRRWLSRRISS